MCSNTLTYDGQEAENVSDVGLFYGVDEADNFNIFNIVSPPAFKGPAVPEGNEFWTPMPSVDSGLLLMGACSQRNAMLSGVILPG
jgi:hypothetical protein